MEDYHNNPDPAKVGVQILGITKYMSAAQKEALKILPDYFIAQGIEPEIYYREPGGMGPMLLEAIEAYLPQVMNGLAATIIYDVSKKVCYAISNWAKMRIKTQSQEEKGTNERPVRATLYGPTGEILVMKDIYEDREDILKDFPS